MSLKYGLAALVVLLTVTTAVAREPSASAPVARPESAVQRAHQRAAPPDTLTTAQRRAIEGFVRRGMQELGLVPGLSLAVVVGDDVVYEGGFGWADVDARRRVTPETVFYTASLAKAFTGMTASVLAAEGALDLDAPLSSFFPGLTSDAPVHGDRVRLRDMLAHDKGFTNGGVNWRTTWVGPMADSTLVRVLNRYSSPADGFVYSNTNYALAGLAIQVATGESWRDDMAAKVFRPLGMDRSTAYASRVDPATFARPYLARHDGVHAIKFPKTDATVTGAGGIFSTAHDLARFVVANLNDGRVDGRQALPAAAVREAQRAQVDVDADFFEFHRFAYGLGFYRARWDGDLLVHHFGGFPGYRSHLSFMPERGLGVVVLQNEGIDGSRFADIVAAYVYDVLLGRDADARARSRLDAMRRAVAENREARADQVTRLEALRQAPETAARPLDAYTGHYANERLGTLLVMADGDRLRIVWGDLHGPGLPTGGDTFLVDWIPGNPPATFEFTVDGDRVTGFDWGGRPFERVGG